MKRSQVAVYALLLTGWLSAACAPFAVAQGPQSAVRINGEAPVTLRRTHTPDATKPEFTGITVMPGRGMEVQQITAWFPGKGEMHVLASPDLKQTASMLNNRDTANGDLGYRLGAAFLFPYPNRIRGKLSSDGKMLTAVWNGRSVTLPANNVGARPEAERHAMHGLILKGKVTDVRVTRTAAGGTITGILHCGDFGGHWFSSSDLSYTITLTATSVEVSITAKNVGNASEPVALGWHPYFALPSKDRKQVRLHIPGSVLTVVDNYDNVFPTGKLMPVAGTAYDFQAPDGKALGGQFLDDNFSSLERTKGAVVVKVLDPAAHYGVEIDGLSPEIRTVQVYAPPTQNFVAVEDQYNFGDPFGKEWGTMNTGMVTLAPGKSTQWRVRLGLLQP
jgi:galactose mutarotase-like enzyme